MSTRPVISTTSKTQEGSAEKAAEKAAAAEEEAAAAAKANAANRVNIGGDIYTSMKEFQKNYGLTTSGEADTLFRLFDARTGLLPKDVALSTVNHALVKKALTARIKAISSQLNDIRTRNILIYQRLRGIHATLEGILRSLNPSAAAATATSLVPVPEGLTNNLMTLLLKIAYYVAHPDKVTDESKIAFTSFIAATSALTNPGNLLNITSNPVSEEAPLLLNKANVANVSKKYTNVTKYIEAVTGASTAKTAELTSLQGRIEALLGVMTTYQFIDEGEKDSLIKSKTSSISPLEKRIKDRFSTSMTQLLTFYRDLYGPVIYGIFNTEKFLKIYYRPKPVVKNVTTKATTATQATTTVAISAIPNAPANPVHECLTILEGIMRKVYKKLLVPVLADNNPYDALGIYKFGSTMSNQLMPFITNYVSNTRGSGINDSTAQISKSNQPFAWFVLGSSIHVPEGGVLAKLSPQKTSSETATTTTTLVKTLKDFFEKTNVYMFVNLGYPTNITQTPCLLHTYDANSKDPEDDKIATWNSTLLGRFKFTPSATSTPFGATTYSFTIAGPTLEAIGIGESDISKYTIQTHLSVSVFQMLTFLAATNQSVPASKQYDKLVLPLD